MYLFFVHPALCLSSWNIIISVVSRLHTRTIYLNQFWKQNYLKIPKVSEYSRKFPIFPQNSQNSRWKFTTLKIPGNFASLGITVDQNLTWKNHVDDLAKKCSRSIGILHKVKQFLPESALLSLYYTLFLSHINYGITAWSSANSVDKDWLHVLQKRTLRAVNNSEYRSHSNPLFIKYNQLKISDLCNHNIGIFMYKYCNNLLPICLKLMLKTMIIILEIHWSLNILITNLTFVTNLFATRVLKLGITYQIMLKIVKT